MVDLPWKIKQGMLILTNEETAEWGVGIFLGGRGLVGDLVCYGIAHQVRHIVDIHLFHQMSFMGADSFVADEQLLGDFIDTLAGDKQTKYLKLTIRQVLVRKLSFRYSDFVDEHFEHCRTEVLFAAHYVAYSVHDDC